MTHRNRKLALRASAALALVFMSNAALGAEQGFNIPEQSLSDAIAAYVEQADIQLLYSDGDLAGLTSGAVSGTYEPEEALTILLEGSGLEFVQGPDGALIVTRPAATNANERVRGGLARQRPVIADEVIITGTNIRGIAPDSSPTIVFDREAIDKTGFQSTELFFRSLPQNAGGTDTRSSRVPLLSGDGSDNNISGASVNLRGLGAGATLTLLNGRRLAPAGRTSGFTDITSIPLSAVERVEILTDGASAIYGSDAIAGVVNFILRDDYEGAETQVSFGAVTEGDLNQYRLTQLVGDQWDSGNVLLSYEYFKQDELKAEGKGFAAEAPDPFTLLPRETRHSIILSFSQDLTTNVRFSIDGNYSDRDAEDIFNLGGLSNNAISRNLSSSEQYAIAPQIEIDLPANWRLRLDGNYAKTSGLRDAVPLNEFAVERTFENDGSLWSAGLILDGPVFSLPGGDVRLVAGAEFRSEDFSFISSASTEISSDRDVYALFSEAFIPIIGSENSIPGIQRFEITAAGRLDDYSDFGNTINPKVGALWSPLNSLNVRGTYGTSFKPPNLGNLNSPIGRLIILRLPNPDAVGGTSLSAFTSGMKPDLVPEESRSFSLGFDYTKSAGRNSISLSSTYYDINFKNLLAEVPLPGGSLIGIIPGRDLLPSSFVFEDPSQEIINEAVAFASARQGVLDFSGLSLLQPDGSVIADPIEFFFDIREQNLAQANTRGLDFSLMLERDGLLGDWTVGLNGNYVAELSRRASEDSEEFDLVDTIFNPADLSLRGQVGWSGGPWNLSGFINYTDSYIDARDVMATRSIDSYTTFDVNIRYAVGTSNVRTLLSDFDVSVGVLNLLDENPPSVGNDRFDGPAFTNAGYDPANADPLGRFVYFEIRKRW